MVDLRLSWQQAISAGGPAVARLGPACHWTAHGCPTRQTGFVHQVIARRLLIAVPILFGVSIVTFLFANLAPGDPLSTLARPGEGVRPSDLAGLRVRSGWTSRSTSAT